MRAAALLVVFLVLACPAWSQDDWFDRVLSIKAEQPAWMTPVVTVTPRLEQEFRYDVVRRQDPDATNFGFGKGLEPIPARPLQISVSVPSYLTSPSARGIGDISVVGKLRLWSSPESAHNDIVTVFFGATFPTGGARVTADTVVLTPTLAAGKGWGRFDVQSTLGVNVPVNGTEKTTAWNTALQLHLGRYFWPEVETNATWFLTRRLQQTFVTPGLVIGRIHVTERVGLSVGAGVGFAVSDYRSESRRITFTIRFPFPI